MSSPDDARQLATSLPEASSDEHHGIDDVRIRTKVFPSLRAESLRVRLIEEEGE